MNNCHTLKHTSEFKGIKSSSTKSNADVTREWKKENSDKVKDYAKKFNSTYYQRTKEKRSLEFKIDYHRHAISNCVPRTYYEDIDVNAADGLQHITADHDYFDNKFCRPFMLWRTIMGRDLTLQELQTNIDYVLRLQKKNIIPKFLVLPAETYKLYLQLKSLEGNQMMSMLHVKEEDWSKHFKEHWKERDKLFVKLLDENYTKHIAKANN